MHLPPALRPVAEEVCTLGNGSSLVLPKATLTFSLWRGAPLADTFGGKPTLFHGGEPRFAELGQGGKGNNILQVQQMARHANIATTLKYYHEYRRMKSAAEFDIDL